ncbi:flavin-containing monooxygenase [Mycobacterium sp. Aquia_213]|uniref:flavin-containing monooxygenase n=1 Tax=Mycobacterium sp. Aquia_213 TaxID=2991728 RepID=UPI00226E26AF|nr:NAD(P)/FAD-dependent oxidoreductase [Mycobacterium sp. Aquia_213]WAC93712.1 NAD(P)/FAD-dependent oxidoreductase [Mycobacterium sp. Aquia_213]
MTQQRRVKVAVIGAGVSGLCMAAKLQDAGIESFTVFEKADEVGGTWRDNTYPGLTCDVPSRFYSYSFAPNPNWSRLLSPGPELQAYFRRVADERGIRRHIRFGCDVTRAEYEDGTWHLTTTFGEETFDVVVAATGILRIPNYPDIPGRETFAGVAFHSSRWDHSVTLPDKRIGVIGNGSSGVQIMAELGDGKVRHLTLFQRTAQWVLPLPNARYSRLTRQLLTRVPAFNVLGHWFWGNFSRRVLGRAPIRPGLRRSLVQASCRWNLRSVRDPELRAKLTPSYQPMCKRLAMSGRFYRSVQHPTVDVVTDRIDHIEPRGIVTVDGTLHELDLLVYATGFDARAYVRPLQLIGEGGITLDEAWADGPVAYRSVAVPRFPNLFMLIGPHSPIGHQSYMAIAEDQADYAIWWIKQLRTGLVHSAAPTEVATKEYNERLKAAIPQTIWASGCNSWYVGKDGLPEVFPWTPETHTQLLRRPELADFDVRTS